MKHTSHFGFSTKDKYIEFDLSIKLSTDFKFFFWTKDLPPQLQDLKATSSQDRQYFDSFYELKTAVTQLIEEFEVSLLEETKTKVILYQIETETVHGQTINFKWYVCQKVEISNMDGRKEARYFRENTTTSGHYSTSLSELSTHQIFDDNFNEMAWTSERALWFKSLEESVNELAQRLTLGFGKKPEILARKIDQGAKFLLTGVERNENNVK